jgi:hypothetical protein
MALVHRILDLYRIDSRYTHQVVDQAALLRPLVKASFEIEWQGKTWTTATRSSE